MGKQVERIYAQDLRIYAQYLRIYAGFKRIYAAFWGVLFQFARVLVTFLHFVANFRAFACLFSPKPCSNSCLISIQEKLEAILWRFILKFRYKPLHFWIFVSFLRILRVWCSWFILLEFAHVCACNCLALCILVLVLVLLWILRWNLDGYVAWTYTPHFGRISSPFLAKLLFEMCLQFGLGLLGISWNVNSSFVVEPLMILAWMLMNYFETCLVCLSKHQKLITWWLLAISRHFKTWKHLMMSFELL